MRKLIVSMNMTLNGFMAGPNEELDWHFSSWTDEMYDYARAQLAMVDTILLGRVTYETMAAYWPSAPPGDFSFMMNEYTKIVLSRSLPALAWKNSKFLNGNTAQEIRRLKMSRGQNIIVFGSGSVVHLLTELNLVDEYCIWVHPVLISGGHPLFNGPPGQVNLQLINSRIFNSGVAILKYRPGR